MSVEAVWWAERAWLPSAHGEGWADAVLLRVGADGYWAEITPGVAAPAHAVTLTGPVLPGLVDAHSHAFQRAFAGLAERRESPDDDFWSWRERMYRVALRITPDELRDIAAWLDVELLKGGYTQVCEFHYLHHELNGAAYDDPLTMAWMLADAASDAGIALTVLPVLYERAGFAQASLQADQRRFGTDPAWVDEACRRINEARRHLVDAGVAVHSLRAASAESIAALLRRDDGGDRPIHIHVAEQQREVDECLAGTGMRPIEWLCANFALDARWQLVHATHSVASEIDAVARAGAGIVLTPGTEANLGDGLPDLDGWLGAGVPIGIGSDSQVTRAWPEELRWLEYGQRLAGRRRNVAADPERGQAATAARLWTQILRGGAAAAGHAWWGLQVGARADAIVLDADDPALLGVPASHTLDALVFSTPTNAIRDVCVGGRWVIRDRRHADEARLASRFEAAMHALWVTND